MWTGRWQPGPGTMRPTLQLPSVPAKVMTCAERAVELRSRLAARLVTTGPIRSAEWRHVFERVPRHLFVPRFHRRIESPDYGVDAYELVDGEDLEQHDAWLDHVYGDHALVTQYSSQPPHSATSSSSQPTIMARMLEALDVALGQRVLEIGTGTGYNAALLCERLGSDHVTTVEVDADLVVVARERLTIAGYTPTVALSDGSGGYPSGAPFDRIIATCMVGRVPRAWIDQTRPGGRVITPVPGNLAQLSLMPDGSAAGRFHPLGVGFMGMRGGAPERLTWPGLMSLANQRGERRSRRHPIDITHAGGEGSPFWSFVQLLAIPFDAAFPAGPRLGGLVDLGDHSWVRLELEGDAVTQGGPRRLWDIIEDLFDRWCQLGGPGRERFGLTVGVDGRHTVWLDTADSRDSWELAGWAVRRSA
jgi:protein-L-isoaspartate(D-aspartate) O-methyltransferase